MNEQTIATDGTAEGAPRDKDDFYVTPPWATRAVLKWLDARLGVGWRPRRILDVGCGTGAIARVLQAHYPEATIEGVEIDPGRARSCTLELGIKVAVRDYAGAGLVVPPYDYVTGNPPFKRMLAFAERMQHDARGGVASMLAPIQWISSGGLKQPERRAFLRRTRPFVGMLGRRPIFGLNKEGKPGTDQKEYAWLVWGAGREGEYDILDCEAREPRPRALPAKLDAERLRAELVDLGYEVPAAALMTRTDPEVASVARWAIRARLAADAGGKPPRRPGWLVPYHVPAPAPGE